MVHNHLTLLASRYVVPIANTQGTLNMDANRNASVSGLLIVFG